MLEILCRHQCTYESLFAIFNGEKQCMFFTMDLLDHSGFIGSHYGFIGPLLDHSGFSYENTWSDVTSIQWYKMAAGFFILQSDR